LIERRIGLDVDQPQHFWAGRHADNQEQDDIGNLDLLGHKTSDGADGENKAAGKQGGFAISVTADDSNSFSPIAIISNWRAFCFFGCSAQATREDAARRVVKLQDRLPPSHPVLRILVVPAKQLSALGRHSEMGRRL
jgi:hypothetical protein